MYQALRMRRAADVQANFRTSCPACHDSVLPRTSISKVAGAWVHTKCAPQRLPRLSTHKSKLRQRTPPPERSGGTRALADRELHQMISRHLGDYGRQR